MRPFTFGFVLAACLGATAEAGFKAGVAVKVITPAEPIWMAGYGARTKPAEGKIHDLYVKAVALEDDAGTRLVILTSDLCGFSRNVSAQVASEVRKRTGLPRECLMLTASHTHSGPVVYGNLTDMYPMSREQLARVKAYTERLTGWMVECVARALADLKPAELRAGEGEATFATNRRANREAELSGTAERKGPVDHAVPVLRVTDAESGRLRAVVFGYACHNTTLADYEWCGDYAGFAMAELEKRHPGCTALFWSGCGGDANPLPRRSLELCQGYGRRLADAVDVVLAREAAPIRGVLLARYREITLPFGELPGVEAWREEARSERIAVRKRAERMLALIESGEGLPRDYPHYPVQVWRLGDGPLWVSLGGEVVVDYALRLKRESASDAPVWVTAYANDVMAYVGSARVIREGGYEGDTSMIYYGMPGRWDPAVEGRIVRAVGALVRGE